jgi:hypothetical protein
MYIVRFNKEALRINICNLYSSLELTSPVYFSNSTCHVSPSQQTYISITLETSFEIAPDQKTVKGALLYKLQRKCTTKTDNHLNNSTTPIRNTETSIYLLTGWEIEDDDHKFYVCLIECTGEFTWDEDKLWVLHHFCKDWSECQSRWNYNKLSSSCLMHNCLGIKMRCNMMYRSDYKLDIVVDEGTGQYSLSKPMKIDSKRLVLPLSMRIVLIYDLSLPIQPSFKFNIYNQCLNADLASPVYITSDGLECHIPLDYRVYTGDVMRSGFIINESDDTSYGVLIYRLQRRQSHEYTRVGKDTLGDAHLLVVWRVSESNKLYADVLLVKHDKGFDLDKDDLEELYHKNFS